MATVAPVGLSAGSNLFPVDPRVSARRTETVSQTPHLQDAHPLENVTVLESRSDPLTVYCPGCNEAFLGVSQGSVCPRCGMPATPDIGTLKTMLLRASDQDSKPVRPPTENDEDLNELVGTTLDNYEIESLLGRGGMGWVFLARHLYLNRSCALKLLSPALVADDPDYLDRFCTEGQAAASLVHPNVVTVHAIGQYEELNYLEMEFVPGRSLQHDLRDGPLPALRAVAIALGIANGLAAAHRLGIVHRDLKPDNVLLSHRGVPKIADFGLAKRVRGTSHWDRPGTIAGTPHFMAPELFNGADATPTSDVYALGVCLYFMLTGRLPFVKDGMPALIQSVTHGCPPSIRQLRPEIPLEITECVGLLLDTTPANRPQCGIEAAQLLTAILGQSRDLETLLHEALDHESHVEWRRANGHYRAAVTLADGRQQTVFIENSDHPEFHERLVQIYSLCCPAQEHYFEDALKLNSNLAHGAIALREIDGQVYFVMLSAYPRGTTDAEEIRRSVLELALHADLVEHQLTGDDCH